jgi:hypothetical protein
MNKYISSAFLLSISFLTSCSTIGEFRQDPSTWGNKEVAAQAPVYTAPATLPAPQKVVVREVQPEVVAPPVIMKEENTLPKPTVTQGRTITGFIEPNVTKLPDNKDLQESNNIAPNLTPLQPTLRDIESSIPSILPIDPTSPLPANP